MKRTFFTLCFAYLPAMLHAQNNSGTITYKETMKLNLQLDAQTAGFKDMLPKEQSTNTVLYYNNDMAMYEYEKANNAQDKVEQQSGGAMVKINITTPDDKTYMDLKESKMIEQKDLMSRKFLITSEMDKPQWRLTGEQKTILNYPCQEAVLTDGKDTTIAWFTAAIPISAGPQGYYGLPGMILEISQNNGFSLVAIKVNIGEADKKHFEKPKGGKKVTKDEYKAIEKQKMEEMKEQYGGNGNVIIKIAK